MKAFRYERPQTIEAAVEASSVAGSLLKANGLDVLDRLKERVDEPDRVVTLVDVPGLATIEKIESGVRIGAMATLADVASSTVLDEWSADFGLALREAAGKAASPQLRNRATVGGNLCQHTRCGYYRLASFPCFKRGVDACPVRNSGAVQETAGVFGNDPCACAHPSSLAPILSALDANVVVMSKGGVSRLPIKRLYTMPVYGKTSDTTLSPGDLIVGVEIHTQAGRRSFFDEIRQRAAFDWALVSCGISVTGGIDKIASASIVLGAVAPIPWRAEAAEKAIVGKSMKEALAVVGDAAVAGATPLPGTAYKLDLIRAVVERTLRTACGGC